jgi:hypothetical protein
MINGEIRDWQITASSTLWDFDCHEKNARLYQSFDRAWCARHKSDSEWLQIDLGITAKVSRNSYSKFCLDKINNFIIDIRSINSRSS